MEVQKYSTFTITIPYTGKPVEMTDIHIKDTFSLVQRLAEGYEKHEYSLKGTNVSTDMYYTSIPLAKWLHERHITCVGTIQINRNRFPIEMKETKDCEEFSWMSCKEDNGPRILNSYVVKTKSARKKNVLLVQTTNIAP